MRIEYILTTHADTHGEPLLCTAIVGRIFPNSSNFPHSDDDDAYEQDAQRISLGNILYPKSLSGDEVLPPMLLLEPIDDPDTAKQRYAIYQGIRYSAHFLLPEGDEMGEPVAVVASREALSLWWQLLPLSARHAEGYAHYKHMQTDLLQPTKEALQLVEASREQNALLLHLWMILQQGNALERAKAIRKIGMLEKTFFPPTLLLPSLNDSSEEVRTLASHVLGTELDSIPIERLISIVEGAEIRAKLAAIPLLGRVGGDEAIEALWKARWSKHAWVRAAALRTLAVTVPNDPDVLENVLIALRKDDVPSVREAMRATVQGLGGIATVEAGLIGQLGLH